MKKKKKILKFRNNTITVIGNDNNLLIDKFDEINIIGNNNKLNFQKSSTLKIDSNEYNKEVKNQNQNSIYAKFYAIISTYDLLYKALRFMSDIGIDINNIGNTPYLILIIYKISSHIKRSEFIKIITNIFIICFSFYHKIHQRLVDYLF